MDNIAAKQTLLHETHNRFVLVREKAGPKSEKTFSCMF